MNSVVHFEIHAVDPERAAAFYRRVSGWDTREWTMGVIGKCRG
jgi:predicted enzyme related to lactoylglutathione lyase